MAHPGRSYGKLISAMLLLCFSVTVLPLDLLHKHKAQPVCQEAAMGKQAACHHKLHVSARTPYCWVCAIHYDKAFLGTAVYATTVTAVTAPVFTEIHLDGFFTKLIATSLRGPPLA
ncbi:hypothetical protein [Hufsiella ginkgonis]|uniref:DUF2946 domain-containing protein n=1 Tax=Hufsiella ginkgonis TaxID=2695274 RepID=A0A7K1XUK8_9SPHI|nr:hypothetical protein [Hufsiella ginkgonis]MXV14487.1 hypothetical protein [Hufsiella ginkgonis]